MSYTITKTNGQTLATVSDGTIDNSSSSLVLIGKNYAGYGRFLNDNFVRLLENFSNNASPSNPIAGQLWWDTTNNILRVWSGASWKISTGATASPANSPPGDLSGLGGDLWYDTSNQQLKVYTGTSWLVVGPPAISTLQQYGIVPEYINSSPLNTPTPVVSITFAGTRLATFSNTSFLSNTAGFTSVKAGLNFNTTFSPALGLGALQDTAANPGTLVQRDASGGATVNQLTATTVSASSLAVSGTITGSFSGNLSGNVSGINNTVSAVSVNASGGITASSGFNGVINTANQPNVTGLGNVYNLTANGPAISFTGLAKYNGFEIATQGGSGSFSSINNTPIGNLTPSTGAFTTLTVTTQMIPAANAVVDIGSTGSWFRNIYGKAIQAQYADLAERFEADAYYPAGTVVEMGGTKEITKVSAELSDKVFGVISTNAAYLMNSAAGNDYTHPPIAMSGRVPVRVIGMIAKGDRLVSAGNGIARAGNKNEITAFNVIGRSLVNKLDAGEGVIEAIVKINS